MGREEVEEESREGRGRRRPEPPSVSEASRDVQHSCAASGKREGKEGQRHAPSPFAGKRVAGNDGESAGAWKRER